jgi:hypothetical protein
MAFLAMAQHQVGQSGKALATLARLRECMKKPGSSANEESPSLLREADALIEGKTADSNK